MQAFLKSGKLAGKEEVTSNKDSGRSSTKVKKKPTPWVEKYRPHTIDDVVEQCEIVSMLKQCLSGADLPHFLFYGPPGTGKTSTIMAAARQLFGDMYKDRILELNASDERGIQVIRDKVKLFSQTTVSSTRPDGKPCPPYKIVILDEADSMTHAAQSALRRTMEKETRSTRFCLICNYVSSIIQPLTSRCAKFRFKPLGDTVVLSRLKHICEQEGVLYEPTALETLTTACAGDLRRAITSLQSCARLQVGNSISNDDVLEVTGIVPQKYISDLLDICSHHDYRKMEYYVEDVLANAYSAPQVLDQFNDFVVSSPTIPDDKKSFICEKIALCVWRLQEGASEYIQLLDLCCTVITHL